MSVAASIASRGFFPTEPLLAVEEDEEMVVVEGNRRLAALKGLREPSLLKDSHRRALERLKHGMPSSEFLRTVPVVIAPSRRDADKLLVGRHSATAVRAWQAENRASFILDKLENGYSSEALERELGLDAADITAARQTRAIVEMARSLELEDTVRAKLDAPRTKLFSTLERVFDSAPGRQYLRLERSTEHGLLIFASRDRFRAALKRMVEDIVLGHQDSRSLNTAENIREYFEGWGDEGTIPKARAPIVPRDIIGGPSVASPPPPAPQPSPPRNAPPRKSVVPKSFRVADGPEKVKQLRKELTKLGREAFPNCGAVMLRVFLEMAVLHYFEATGRLAPLTASLKEKGKLRFEQPTFGQMATELRAIVRKQFKGNERDRILRALANNRQQPFTVETLNGFVHDLRDYPTPQDVLGFWESVEPLMKFLLSRREKQ